jgi:Ca2+-binding RTX toxin-like protein
MPGAIAGMPGMDMGMGMMPGMNMMPGAIAGMPGAIAGMPGAVAGMPGAVAGMPGAVAGMPGAMTPVGYGPAIMGPAIMGPAPIIVPGYIPPVNGYIPPVDDYRPPVDDYVPPSFTEVITATAANDTLTGGAGNTNFTMTQGTTLGGTDTVTDNGGTDGMTFSNLNNMNMKLILGGTDTATVRSGTTYDGGTITGTVSFTNIENLYLQDSAGGVSERLTVPLSGLGTNIAVAGTTGNDTITLASAGTYANAVIWGQGGVDTLTGGSGADTIYGGAGADVITSGAGTNEHVYVGTGADDVKFTDEAQYTAAEADKKYDIIHGFISGTDELKFTGAGFTGVTTDTTITKGTAADANNVLITLSGGDWVTAGAAAGGVAAGHANQRFLYNQGSGRLYYDADGSASGTAKLVAQLLDATNVVVTDVVAADIDVV